jgi:hypothetical protein
VDGCTAVALVYRFLQRFTTNIDFYIPDRYEEGYGVSYKGVDYARETGVGLIIVLDCGIKATAEIAYAKEHGIDAVSRYMKKYYAGASNYDAVVDWITAMYENYRKGMTGGVGKDRNVMTNR